MQFIWPVRTMDDRTRNALLCLLKNDFALPLTDRMDYLKQCVFNEGISSETKNMLESALNNLQN